MNRSMIRACDHQTHLHVYNIGAWGPGAAWPYLGCVQARVTCPRHIPERPQRGVHVPGASSARPESRRHALPPSHVFLLPLMHREPHSRIPTHIHAFSTSTHAWYVPCTLYMLPIMLTYHPPSMFHSPSVPPAITRPLLCHCP